MENRFFILNFFDLVFFKPNLIDLLETFKKISMDQTRRWGPSVISVSILWNELFHSSVGHDVKDKNICLSSINNNKSSQQKNLKCDKVVNHSYCYKIWTVGH